MVIAVSFGQNEEKDRERRNERNRESPGTPDRATARGDGDIGEPERFKRIRRLNARRNL